MTCRSITQQQTCKNNHTSKHTAGISSSSSENFFLPQKPIFNNKSSHILPRHIYLYPHSLVILLKLNVKMKTSSKLLCHVFVFHFVIFE